MAKVYVSSIRLSRLCSKKCSGSSQSQCMTAIHPSNSTSYLASTSSTQTVYLQTAGLYRICHNLIKFMFHHHHHHHWLNSPWWALAFLRSCAHSSLLRVTFFQFLTPNILIPWSTPSSSGLVLNIFLRVLNPLRCRPWQIGPVLTSSDFVPIFFSQDGVVSATPNPQQSWRTDVFLLGLSPLADQP